MRAYLACLILLSVSISFVCGQQIACKPDCFDYNRICPGIKDTNFYTVYVQKYEAGELGHFSKARLPLSPDCSKPYYQYACPMSCGLCIPCGVQKSYVTGLVSQSEQKLQQADTTLEQKLIEADTSLEQKLIQADADLESRLTAKIEQVSAQAQNQPARCDPCTEVLGATVNNQPACLPKYHTVYETQGDCSCSCGAGTKTLVKKCVTYRKEGGKCEQVDTFVKNCPDGVPSKTESCNNGACTVTEIIESTHEEQWSNSADQMTYKAFTQSGQSCTLGVVAKTDNVQRSRNTTDFYAPSEIETPTCNNICMVKGETFRRLEITISGTDGWKTNYISLSVNGGTSKYTNSKWLDDRLTEDWTKSN